MISLRDFTIGYGKLRLLENVNADIGEATLTALIGRNGTGKSTLLRAIARLNTAYSGEVILNGRDITRMRRAHLDREIVMQSLASVGMEAYARRTMDTMSDGECQRIMIARALAQDTPIILLDEPTSFLDMPNRYELCALLSDLAHKQNKCILFSTHELDIALSLSDSIALIDPPTLHCLPADEMRRSGFIDRLFRNERATFNSASGMVEILNRTD